MINLLQILLSFLSLTPPFSSPDYAAAENPANDPQARSWDDVGQYFE
jgi:hypothetical protein